MKHIRDTADIFISLDARVAYVTGLTPNEVLSIRADIAQALGRLTIAQDRETRLESGSKGLYRKVSNRWAEWRFTQIELEVAGAEEYPANVIANLTEARSVAEAAIWNAYFKVCPMSREKDVRRAMTSAARREYEPEDIAATQRAYDALRADCRITAP